MRPRLSAFILLVLAAVAPAFAASSDNAARIDSVLAWADANRNLVYRDEVTPRWLPDGHRFWYEVDAGPAGKKEFVLVDAATGEVRRASSRDALQLPSPPDTFTSRLSIREAPRRTRRTGPATRVEILNQGASTLRLYWINEQGERIPYGELGAGQTLTRDTYEGHVWSLETETGQPLARFVADADRPRIVVDGPSSGAEPEHAKAGAPGTASPDGLWRVEIRDDNVFLHRHAGADASPPSSGIAITSDGTKDVAYVGPPAWAPDSSAFVLTRVARAPVRQITLTESAPRDQLQPRSRQIDYIKPGDPLPDPTPVLFKVSPASAPALPRVAAHPIARALCPTFFTTHGWIDYRWSPDSREVFFDYNQRGHQRYRILAINAATAAVRAVIDEASDTFIDYTNKTWRHWLPGDRELLWLSERDGFAHLWLHDVSGARAPLQLTRGPWVVRRVEHIDAERRQIWFFAVGLRPGEDPYHLHLCRVNLDGTGFVRLTEGDGTHRVAWSPDRRWFVDTWSRVDQPPVTELRHADDGALVATLERADISALLASGWSLPERFVAPGRDGVTSIHGVLVRPPRADAARPAPVVEEVYAGPQDAFAPKAFSLLPRQQALARLGFVVVQADGMGTNHRGRAFHSIAWKNLGDAGFPDRIAWLKAAAASRPWMDLSRVGIYGGSAGGQSAMRALLDHADFYSVAVADCGCHDNRMDKIWWNEQWLGWPLDESYVSASNAEHADRLRGKLLLIVGEQDTNVDPASTLQVVDRLVRANKPFEFLLLPGVGHGAGETAYGTRRRAEFLLRHLAP